MDEYEMVDVITRECDNCSISSNLQNNTCCTSTRPHRKRIYSQSGLEDDQIEFQSKKLRIEQTFKNIAGPNLLPELLINHIIPYTARDWLCVSKDWGKVALDKLNFDPRVKLNWKSLERAVSCHSVSGVSKHINPMTMKQHSISVWYILDVAIENDSSVIAKHILSDPRMADCNTLNEKLWKAVRWDRPAIVTMMLQHPSIDPIQCGARAVSLATTLGRLTVIETLRRDERIREAEAASALATPWVMPPQPFMLMNAINGPFFSVTGRPATLTRTRPLLMPRPSFIEVVTPVKTRHELLMAVLTDDEQRVKHLLKEDPDSIPLETLQEAANEAISNMRYKLTNMIQQAINRRVKGDVHEPKVL